MKGVLKENNRLILYLYLKEPLRVFVTFITYFNHILRLVKQD